MAGGYFDGNPYLFHFDDSAKSATQDAFQFNWPEMIPYFEKYADTLVSTDSLIKIIPSIIYEFAKSKNKECEIGGPISIVRVTKGNKIEWIQNDFSKHQVANYTTLVKLIESQKRKIYSCVFDGANKAINAMKSNRNYTHQ